MSKILCPACNSQILAHVREGITMFKCEKNVWPPVPGSCTFAIFSDNLLKFGKPEITKSELASLCAGKKIELNLISKAGKNYTCKGELEKREKGYGVKLLFQDFKQQAFPVSDDSTDEESDY